ncbi:MAG TPA: DUF3105 domain-containing protein [Frankiaceae bacterium]|nr:DUF3105 domain-containing protein [Frankiaceae bacterium]
MAKKTPENNRRKLIEEQRKKARAKERRGTVLTIVISSVIGIGLIGSAVYFGQKNKGPNLALHEVGVSKEAAACDPVKEEVIPKEATDDAVKHVDSLVSYDPAPPSSGAHNPSPLPVGSKKFFSRDEDPPPERAVHNLEHGYVVVWYDGRATAEQVELLERAGRGARGKILIMPWTRGNFPGDKSVVLTSWSIKQACSDVSGAVIKEFYDNHGAQKSKAPEKNAI